MTVRRTQGRLRDQRGFSLLELLVVTVILAITTAIVAPLVAERVRMARMRTMVNQFTLDLRAARWTAVSRRTPIDMTVAAVPGNSYEYTDAHGRVRTVEMPEGVRIVSSTNPIRFKANGSVVGGASTVIEAQINDDTTWRWTVNTNVLGVPSTTHQRVGT